MLQRRDRGVEVAVLLLEPRPLLTQLAFFLFGHRRRGSKAGLHPSRWSVFGLKGAPRAGNLGNYPLLAAVVQASSRRTRVNAKRGLLRRTRKRRSTVGPVW